ncbi:MAG: exodeoxyribonuclease VII small subunit [Bacilli bacterium]|jgi:exodeoxyribonuclease VII small subunit
MANKEEKMTFEEKLKRLEVIVETLEHETLDLAKSMALYEEGVNLGKELTKELEEAKIKIETIEKSSK